MMSILNGQRNGAKVASWFRLVALAEALSWVGLLVGMYFKHLATADTEIGVKIFGPLHGGVFVAFLVVALLAGLVFRWGAITWLLALLASIVPLGSVIFVMWAGRTGRLGGEGGLATTPAAAEAA